MKGALAAILRTLVLPAGATSGQRIVLDGTNGLIQVYDASNNLIAEIAPGDVVLVQDPTTGAKINLVAAGGTVPKVLFRPKNFGVHVIGTGMIETDEQTVPDRARLFLQSPNLDGRDRADLVLEEDAGTGPHVFINDSDTPSVGCGLTVFGPIQSGGPASADYLFNGKTMPRGIIPAPAKITANFASGGTVEADVTGLSLTWTAVTGRYYKLSAHSRGIALSIAGRARLAITDSANTHVAEADVDVANPNIVSGPASCWTILTGLSGSVTYKVRASTLAGGGNWTLAGTVEAVLAVEDVAAP